VTFWAEVFLGVIALATLTMAAVQVGVIVYGWALARRVNRLLEQVERDMKPLAENLDAITRDAARISGMAADQIERVDRLVTDLSFRLERTAATVQDAILSPLRDGAALMAGVKTALDAFRELTGRPRPSRTGTNEEDGHFIG
jgi:hypothetical protein